MQVQSLFAPARMPRCAALQHHGARSPLLGLASPLAIAPGRRLALAVRAAKGFGKTKPQPARRGEDAADGDGGEGKSRKAGGKRVRLSQGAVGPIPGQQQRQQLQGPAGAPDLLVPSAPTEEDDEFLARLTALKEQGRERAAASAAAAAAAGASDGAAAAGGAAPAIFDAAPTAPPGEDIYANPPPLSQTLLAAAGGGAAASGISDPKLRDANIGPSQLGLAAGAIVFIAVFLIVAAGDYAPASRRYSGVRPAQAPPDPIEEKILKGKVALYEDALKADPTNDDATEALASSYAKLMQYDKAAELLDKFTKRRVQPTK
ncbi:hypothetical protein GPECTOR_7g1341 [Gonium pectorale]|uniref:Uncharacterized protein n=1 Tax=Gonium pectorale TaxID=33097 RepID=A0A150GUL8_GONPE|nr:hypothetical protein GPECTOR_7g1341 [Gonium pectorale]|eukprot:KXZ53443.1 hypothetical protein GPECTOR_7g1341 [Gonium pectorale]